jgi:hypothetical protein
MRKVQGSRGRVSHRRNRSREGPTAERGSVEQVALRYLAPRQIPQRCFLIARDEQTL